MYRGNNPGRGPGGPDRLRPLVVAAVAVFVVQATVAPAVATADPIQLQEIQLEKGIDYGGTTDAYWAKDLKVYRRGDTFTVTLKTDVVPDVFGMTVKGPPGYTWVFDRIECRRGDGGVECNDGTESARDHVEFVGFDGVSPQFEVALEHPKPVDVRIGRYRIERAFVTDCASDDCAPGTAVETSTKSFEPFYAIFNPFPGSGDSHVTGLARGKLADRTDGYVLGRLGRQYWYGKRVVQRYAVTPTHPTVFEYAIGTVDPLGTTSARRVASVLTTTANGAFPYGDGSVAGRVFLRGVNVRRVIAAIENDRDFCGQCMTYASVLTSLSRSVGIPSRPVTGLHVDYGGVPGKRVAGPAGNGGWWNFHMWTEGWLTQVAGGGWAAYDATTGTGPVNEANKDERLPDARMRAAGVRPSTILADRPSGTAVEVTTNYGDPALANESPVLSVAPRDRVTPYGENLTFDVTVRNPTSNATTATVRVAVVSEFVAGLYRRQPVPVTTRNLSVSVPANGAVTRTVSVPRDVYRVNGRFLAQATTSIDGSTEVSLASVDVRAGLRLRVETPDGATAGERTTATVTVTNLRDEAVSDVEVAVHAPAGANANATNWTVERLDPGQQASFRLALAPTDLPASIEAQATTPEAGVALDSVTLGADGLADGPRLSVGDRPDPIHPGESVTTTVTVTGLPGERVRLHASAPDGISISFDRANGTVGDDGRFTATVTVAADAGRSAGEYTAYVDALGRESGSGVLVLRPTVEPGAEFEVSAEADPTTVATGETVTVAATVRNVGAAPGEATVTLRVDGTVRETRTVAVGAGETGRVEFTTSFEEPGEHAVRINGLGATAITVEQPTGTATATTTTTTDGQPGLGVAVAVVALLVAALLGRPRAGPPPGDGTGPGPG